MPRNVALFALIAALLIASHAPLLRLPYFWDEAGYYVPAARDLLAGSLIPHSTPSNAHPPLVMAWLALIWKILGFRPVVTRCAMLLLAAFSLLGLFRLALAVSNFSVAAWATFLTAVYPVFFAQSSLAQVDLPAAGFIFWGLEYYVRKRVWLAGIWFSLAALTKETAILVPLALLLWEVSMRVINWRASETKAVSQGQSSIGTSGTRALPGWSAAEFILILAPLFLLTLWYAYHYARTGFVFGNPEFFQYNFQANLHPLRIVLALLLRIWHTTGYMNLYVLTIACLLAMRQSQIQDAARPRIAVPVQFTFLAIAVIYVVAMAIVGGAVLARYMLPVVPLVILVCVSTIWRRLQISNWVLGVVALGFIGGLFVNPPYGFAPEDNLAYGDYIRLHQNAELWLQARYPNARVLTAWPATGELTRPDVGYLQKPMRVVQIEDFTAEQLLSAADASSRFDVALVFSTKYQPRTIFDRWEKWQEWKARYFGFHRDLPPEAAAGVLGGRLVYVQRRKGQWLGIIEVQRIEQAANIPISLR